MEDKFFFKKHKVIFKMVLVAIFSALNFAVMLLPKIPIPSLVGKPYVHLGNLVVVLVALFFGGTVGGLAGAIGMGTYDIISGYGIWTIKTVVLKFGIGIVTGLVYKLIRNRRDKTVQREMVYTGAFFLLVSIFTAILAFLQGGTIVIGEKTIDLPWPLYVFSFILGVILVLSAILSKKNNIQKAMFASSMGIIFNIFGELVGGFLKKILQGNGVKVSLAMSIASIPATIINGCVVLFVVFIVFPGLNRALKKMYLIENEDNSSNEDISEDISEDKSEDKSEDISEDKSEQSEITEN